MGWVATNYPKDKSVGDLIAVPECKVAKDANPTEAMWLALLSNFVALKDEVIAMIEDLRKTTARERREQLQAVEADRRFRLPSLAKRLQFGSY